MSKVRDRLLELKPMDNIRISKRLNRTILKDFYQKYMQMGLIHPAEWFSNARKWYRLNHAFNNPYNFGHVHSELLLLMTIEDSLQEFMKNCLLVIWGVGAGDTEMEIVRIQLDNEKQSKVIAIDVNYQFLLDFGYALRNKLKEEEKFRIYYYGINDLFERIKAEDLEVSSNLVNRFHVCLGNTLGDYEISEEIIKIFSRTCKEDDRVVIGFQTFDNIEAIVSKYIQNPLLESLLENISSIDIRRKSIKWVFNREKNQVEAWNESTQLFRSKKFFPSDLQSLFENFGFRLEKQFKDDFSTCIQIYRYQRRNS